MTISLSTVEEKLTHWLDQFDEIHILVTSSEASSRTFPEKIKIHYTAWENDFSKARNYLFSFITTDWIFWIDDDDHVPQKTLQFIQELRQDTLAARPGCYALAYSYTLEDSEEEDFQVLRNNLLKRSAFEKWEYPVFETIQFKNEQDIMILDDVKIIHMIKKGHKESSRTRDMTILSQYLKENPDDTYMLFYQANNYLFVGQPQMAKAIYEKLLLNSSSIGHAHYICSNLANILYDEGNMQEAFRVVDYMARIGFEKNSRDFYIMAKYFFDQNNYEKATMAAEDAIIAFARGNFLPHSQRLKYGQLQPYKLLLKIALLQKDQNRSEKYKKLISDYLHDSK